MAADEIFKCIFSKLVQVQIIVQISQQFVQKHLTENESAVIEVIA